MSRKFSVQIVHLETGLEELIIIHSVVFVVSSDHDDRNIVSKLAEHDNEVLIVEAIVGVKVISNISINHQTINLLLFRNRCKKGIEGDVFALVLVQGRPISQSDDVYLTFTVCHVSDCDWDEISRKGNGVRTAAIPPEDIVVEDLFKVDRRDRALMDGCLIVINIGREVQGSGGAVDLFNSCLLDELDVGLAALLSGIEEYLEFFLRSLIFGNFSIKDASAEGLARLEGQARPDCQANKHCPQHVCIFYR